MVLVVSIFSNCHAVMVNTVIHTQITQCSACISVIRFKLLPSDCQAADLAEEKLEIFVVKAFLWHLYDFQTLLDLVD